MTAPKGLADLGRSGIRDLCADDAIRNPATGRWVRVIDKTDNGDAVTLKTRDVETGAVDYLTRPTTTVFRVYA